MSQEFEARKKLVDEEINKQRDEKRTMRAQAGGQKKVKRGDGQDEETFPVEESKEWAELQMELYEEFQAKNTQFFSSCSP